MHRSLLTFFVLALFFSWSILAQDREPASEEQALTVEEVTALVEAFDSAAEARDLKRTMSFIGLAYRARLMKCEGSEEAMNRGDLYRLFEEMFPIMEVYTRNSTDLVVEIAASSDQAIVDFVLEETVRANEVEMSGKASVRLIVKRAGRGLQIVGMISREHC